MPFAQQIFAAPLAGPHAPTVHFVPLPLNVPVQADFSPSLQVPSAAQHAPNEGPPQPESAQSTADWNVPPRPMQSPSAASVHVVPPTQHAPNLLGSAGGQSVHPVLSPRNELYFVCLQSVSVVTVQRSS